MVTESRYWKQITWELWAQILTGALVKWAEVANCLMWRIKRHQDESHNSRECWQRFKFFKRCGEKCGCSEIWLTKFWYRFSIQVNYQHEDVDSHRNTGINISRDMVRNNTKTERSTLHYKPTVHTEVRMNRELRMEPNKTLPLSFFIPILT